MNIYAIQRTLKKYTNFTEPSCGINTDVIKHFLEEIKEYSDLQKFFGIIFDEMKIKSGLVYNCHSGKIVGFSDIGDMNNELFEFQQRVKNKIDTKPIATSVLTFMVRGLCTSLAYPFAYYAANGFTSGLLFPCVWEAVNVIETIGLKVRFFTSDGASPNRRFYRLHKLDDGENQSDDAVVYWCWNRFSESDNPRKIYFTCDVPHLLKTSRNNLENSHGHNNARHLMVGS